jgi:hypothetical protein
MSSAADTDRGGSTAGAPPLSTLAMLSAALNTAATR